MKITTPIKSMEYKAAGCVRSKEWPFNGVDVYGDDIEFIH